MVLFPDGSPSDNEREVRRRGTQERVNQSRFEVDVKPVTRMAERIKAALVSAGDLATSPELARPKVLVVEDDQHLRRGMVFALRHHFAVSEAADGLRALEVAREDRPEVVILDYLLPHLDGYEVCREVKEDPAYGSPRVIMLTGHGSPEGRARAGEVGADAYLQKPISVAELVWMIDRFVRGSGDLIP